MKKRDGHFLTLFWIQLYVVLSSPTRSDCNRDEESRGANSAIVISSTYFQCWLGRIRPYLELHARSLTITKNSIGPSLVPWGTPALARTHSGRLSLSFTACWRSERKLHIQVTRLRLTFMFKSLRIKMLWSI